MKGRKRVRKRRTVDSIYRKLCAKDEVFIDGHCEKLILMPKERKIIHEELPACKLTLKVDPIEQRAKQRLYRELYKDSKTKMRYKEYIGPTREEIEVINEG